MICFGLLSMRLSPSHDLGHCLAGQTGLTRGFFMFFNHFFSISSLNTRLIKN
jgi:hypothetical protein